MKKYVKPEMEITEFDVEDIINTSDDPAYDPAYDPNEYELPVQRM